MTNDQMKANRFYNWAKARRTVRNIQNHLSNGRTIVISTCTKATKYKKGHEQYFKATKSGAWAQRGKNWECIDFCNIKVYV
jgi:hypothetical protein